MFCDTYIYTYGLYIIRFWYVSFRMCYLEHKLSNFNELYNWVTKLSAVISCWMYKYSL